MERFAIVAHLREGSGPRAAELLAQGPPFELAETGITRHSVYLSASEVVFVFEGHEIEWIVDRLIDEPFHPQIRRVLDQWRTLVDGPPRLARALFAWERKQTEPPTADAFIGSGQWA